MSSSHHVDVAWCVVGPVSIMYHTSISMNTSVTYDERSVFGSHGAYAVWTGTAPRSYSISASLVGANTMETAFNVSQVRNAYDWTQQSPPRCNNLTLPNMNNRSLFEAAVRIENVDTSIPEMTHTDNASHAPIQIEFSMSLKECKPI